MRGALAAVGCIAADAPDVAGRMVGSAFALTSFDAAIGVRGVDERIARRKSGKKRR